MPLKNFFCRSRSTTVTHHIRIRYVTCRAKISPEYREEYNRSMMKDTEDTRRVTTPDRQREGISRKRTLRSRTVRAARSVWSEHQSRVIESRKIRKARVFLLREGRTELSWAAKAEDKMARPGSESRAKMYRGIPGTWEGLYLLDQKGKVLQSKRKTRKAGREIGRLSSLIVVIESRETLPGGACE